MKFRNLKLIKITFLIFLISHFSISQGIENKKIQAGITTNFGLNLTTMGTSKINDNGTGTNFSIGLLFHKSFEDSKNFGLASGLEFDFSSIKFASNPTEDTIYYNYNDREILPSSSTNQSIFQLQTRKHKTLLVTLPVSLLFRTDPVGSFRYFAKFGIKNSFLISNKMVDKGKDISNPAIPKENLNMTSKNEMFFYQLSLGLSFGAEWNFIGSTCLVAEMGYYYGLTPLFLDRKEDNQTLYIKDDGVNTPFSNKATLNQLNLKFAVLF
jgi:hypothetical protein